jgi:hypothetical protein
VLKLVCKAMQAAGGKLKLRSASWGKAVGFGGEVGREREIVDFWGEK